MALSKFVPLANIHVIATDIDKQVLGQAKTGIYDARSIVSVPPDMKAKYFSKVGSSFRISDEIKKHVEFREHDLLRDNYPTGCHLIVCRNVVIYFTDEAKTEIYKKFHRALTPGGMLFIGSTEQVMDYKEIGYERKRSFFFEKR
jgi:chemotaxis protein methyltransferase CheR